MMSDLSAKRGPVGFVICIVIIFAVLVGLGSWQVQRLVWKEGLIAERDQALAQRPIEISSINDKTPEWRRVTLTGRAVQATPLFVGPLSLRGRPGWYVISPLRLADGGIVLVNRGWVASREAGLVPLSANPVSIGGFLRRAGKRGMFGPANDPDADQWFFVEPTRMAEKLNIKPVAAFWVVAEASKDRPSQGPIAVGRPETLPNNHLQYAGTWFGLALVTFVMGILYWRRRRA